VVALDWIHGDVGPVEGLLNGDGDVISCVADLLVVVGPDVVRRVVAGPHEDVGLDGITDKAEHALKTDLWDVAFVGSPRASLALGVAREPVAGAAAEESSALRV